MINNLMLLYLYLIHLPDTSKYFSRGSNQIRVNFYTTFLSFKTVGSLTLKKKKTFH